MYEPYENQNNESQEESTYHYTSAQDAPIVDALPVWEDPEPVEEEPVIIEPVPQPKAAKKEKKGWPLSSVIAVALICSILGGALGAGGMLLGNRLLDDPEETQGQEATLPGDSTTVIEGIRDAVVIDTVKIETGKLLTQAEVYAANVNCTVGITTSITTNFWGYQSTSAASGSGFIYSTDGYILTNYHVIEGSSSIKVTMYNGKTFDAKLIGYDEGNDVAVLKVETTGLTPVVLGNSDNINVGDSVVAIGNPLGELTFSLTAGSISAKEREITMSSGSTMRLMQTDCAINSGNSGGALFNLYGEVIGITNAKYSSNSSTEASIDNIGFAIPINKARQIADSIIEKGYVSKPYVGLSVATVSAETQSYGLPKGAAVKSVGDDSPAAKAGIKVNDIITHVNGTEISTSSELVTLVGDAQIGDTITFTVYRQGKTSDITVTVGEQIQSAQNQQASQSQQQAPQYPWGY